MKPARKSSPKTPDDMLAHAAASLPPRESPEDFWRMHRRDLRRAARNVATILQELQEVAEQATVGNVRYTMDALRTAERQLEAAMERLAEANGLVGVEVA